MKIGLPIPEYEDHFEGDTNLKVQNSLGGKVANVKERNIKFLHRLKLNWEFE